MRLSYLIALLTALQFIYMAISIYYPDTPKTFPFDVYHEDLIFILHLMTYFIVASIERAVDRLKE